MPYFAGPVADERDALLTFLAVPRAALRAAVFGLTDFQLTGEESLDDVLRYYAETAELTARIVTAVGDLGQPSAVNPEQSVRWVLFHLIQETSRHAGHADIIREALDGAAANCWMPTKPDRWQRSGSEPPLTCRPAPVSIVGRRCPTQATVTTCWHTRST